MDDVPSEKREETVREFGRMLRRSRGAGFGRILELLRAPKLDESLWEEIEETLITSDVGVQTTLYLIDRLKFLKQQESMSQPQEILTALRGELLAIVDDVESREVAVGRPPVGNIPHVVLVIGVNGVGKTTSVAKLGAYYKKMGNTVMMAAADTFRAAAIDQLKILGEKLEIDVIAHSHGADPGAVVYDAFQASRSRGVEVLLVDTAGRLHTKYNLMQEMEKIWRVINKLDPKAPHQVILVIDATTGYNGLAQARAFMALVNCTGVFLAKMDGTARGGIALSIKRELGIPLRFIGIGESAQDLMVFEGEQFVDALLDPLM